MFENLWPIQKNQCKNHAPENHGASNCIVPVKFFGEVIWDGDLKKIHNYSFDNFVTLTVMPDNNTHFEEISAVLNHIKKPNAIIR